MLALLPKRFSILLVLIGVLFLSGCETPPAKPGKADNGGSYYPSKATEDLDVRVLPWGVVAGRMNAYTRRRHVPESAIGRELFVENFDQVPPQQIPGWRVVGPVELKPVLLEFEQGFELRSPEQTLATCGIERPVEASLLAGHKVRVELRLTCQSVQQEKALEGIDFFIRVEDVRGDEYSLPLPIHAAQTPGWETQCWWLRFEEDLSAISFCLHARRGNSRIILDRLRVVEADLSLRQLLRRPLKEAEKVQTALNAVIGGDFEAGCSGFYTSAISRWPNGEKMVVPLNWEFAGEGVSGERSLRIHLAEETGRVVFGPLDLQPLAHGRYEQGIWFHLYFHARCERPTSVTVMLHIPSRIVGRATFQLSRNWQPYSQRFFVTASSYEARCDLARAELVFDFTGDGNDPPNHCQLDGVSLADQPLQKSYVQPSPVEVGLLGPVPDPVDLSNLVDVGETVGFGVRLTTEADGLRKLWPVEQPTSAPAQPTTTAPEADKQKSSAQGSLAIDVLDAWDRVVWTRTTTPNLFEQPVYNEMVRLQLPRGYYRVLVSYWTGEPGMSELLSRDVLSLAVISLDDPVPLNNQFGLSLSETNVSTRTTHLGAGWVWAELLANQVKVKPGLYDFSDWQVIARKCRHNSVQLIVGLTLPHSKLLWKLFAEQLVADPHALPIGIMIRPPAIGTDPLANHQAQLSWFRDLLQERQQDVLLMRYFSRGMDVSAMRQSVEQKLADVIAVSCPQKLIPEMNEPQLEKYSDLRLADRRVMDLRVPVQLGGLSEHNVQVIQRLAGPAQRLSDQLDPLVSASRMVRAMLIRKLAGAELACCDATALSPVRSLYDDGTRRLHEPDMTPRPAIVAFDLMAELLNDATLMRWIDYPDGSRILYYRKNDGRAVAAIWRLYGLSMTPIALPALPDDFRVMDCFGLPESLQARAQKSIIEANEIVRYIVVPKGQQQVMENALNEAKLDYGHEETDDR